VELTATIKGYSLDQLIDAVHEDISKEIGAIIESRIHDEITKTVKEAFSGDIREQIRKAVSDIVDAGWREKDSRRDLVGNRTTLSQHVANTVRNERWGIQGMVEQCASAAIRTALAMEFKADLLDLRKEFRAKFEAHIDEMMVTAARDILSAKRVV